MSPTVDSDHISELKMHAQGSTTSSFKGDMGEGLRGKNPGARESVETGAGYQVRGLAPDSGFGFLAAAKLFEQAELAAGKSYVDGVEIAEGSVSEIPAYPSNVLDIEGFEGFDGHGAMDARAR